MMIMPIKAKRPPKKRATGFVLEIREYKSFAEADQADREYWWSMRPIERLRELERLRQFNYNYGNGKPLPRFQRTLRVVELGEG